MYTSIRENGCPSLCTLYINSDLKSGKLRDLEQIPVHNRRLNNSNSNPAVYSLSTKEAVTTPTTTKTDATKVPVANPGKLGLEPCQDNIKLHLNPGPVSPCH